MPIGKISGRTTKSAINKARRNGFVVTKIKRLHKNHNIKNGHVGYYMAGGKHMYVIHYHRRK